MGLSGALYNAISGLNATQTSISLVSENVANAGTKGYTKKTAHAENAIAGTRASGVAIADITRTIDLLLQKQLRNEISAEGATAIKANVLSRLDQMLGIPGEDGSLDNTYDRFVNALRGLADSPGSVEARADVVNRAATLAQQLNGLSTRVQDFRKEAEIGIERSVTEMNRLIHELADVNEKINRDDVATSGAQALLDQRDLVITEMSQYMELNVQAGVDGTARVFTSSGHLLVDGEFFQTLNFDGRPSITAKAAYSLDPAERDVGTVYLNDGSGSVVDLFAANGIRGGKIGAYRELRDDILVQGQAQLDEIAAALASALSSRQVDGSAVAVGAQSGFDLEVAGLKAGNPVSVTYTLTPPGTEQTVTLVRVDDASVLPLDDSHTANPDDTVVGIDFSGGLAAAAAAIDAALPGAFDVTSPAADTLRFLDDGAAATLSIGSVGSVNTVTALADDGLALALFTDGIGADPYTGSVEADQKRGFSGRISVNPLVVADTSSLVVHSTSPPTSNGDATRPMELLSRLVDGEVEFSPSSGIGSKGSPVRESVGDFVRRVIATQAAQAEDAQLTNSSQSTLTRALETRMQETSGVNIDQELADLIVLQNSFAANARVMSAVQELMQVLLRI